MNNNERKIAIVLVIIIIMVFVYYFILHGSTEGFEDKDEHTDPLDGIVKEGVRGRRGHRRRHRGGRGGRGGRRYSGPYGAGWSLPRQPRRRHYRRHHRPVYRSRNYYNPVYYYPEDYYPVDNVFDCMDSCRFRYDRVPCINACRRIYGV